jgi:MFS family permease
VTDVVAGTPDAGHPDTGLPNRWLVLGLLLLVAVLNYADRYLLAGLAQVLKQAFALSDTMLGVLLGPAFAVLYTILGVPMARLADRGSRLAVACLGCLAWSLFTLLTALATSPLGLIAARVGVGIGEAAYQAPVAALAAAYFPVAERGRAFAVLTTAVYLGQLGGLAGGPALAHGAGWRLPFVALGLCGMVVAGLAYALIREPARAPSTRYEPLGPLVTLLGRAACWRQLTLGLALGSLSGVTFGLWATALFERAYHLSNKAAGAAFGVPVGLSGLTGTLMFGLLADRLARRDPAAPLRLASLALAAATASIMVTTWAPGLGLAEAMALPSGLLGGGWSVAVMAGFQSLLPDRMRAAGTALALLVVGLAANVVGPLLTGWLSDGLGAGAIGLRLALSLIIPTGLIGALALWRASASLGPDRARLAG